MPKCSCGHMLPARINPQVRMARYDIKIGIVMKNRHIGSNSDSAYQTIDQLANSHSLPATHAVKRSSIIIVTRSRGKYDAPRQQTLQATQVPLIASTGQHFHSYRITDSDFTVKQCINAITDIGTGAAKKFYPRGRIDKNHDRRSDRISSRSPSQPEPRRRRASSISSGSDARVRNAKFTASRFVASL